MENQRFGSLVVVGPAPPIPRSNGKVRKAFFARCDCGTIKAFPVDNLRSGNSKSCGCQKYRGFRTATAIKSTPQVWKVDGDIATIEVKGVTVTVDAADVPLVERYKWGLNGNYAVARGGRLSMHRLILGLEKGDPREGDHRYHNLTDNRRSQLRIVNSQQNKMNRHANKRGTSKFKGVHFDKDRNRYVAQIKVGDDHKLIGRFVDELDAARAYDREASKHFGKYAVLNAA